MSLNGGLGVKPLKKKRKTSSGNLLDKQLTSLEKKLGVYKPPEDDRNAIEKALNMPNKTGFLGDTLDLLSRFNYASANAVKGGMEGKNPLLEAWHGLSGKDRTTYSDVLDKAGVKNKYVKAVGGIAGDVLLDPTTYATLGTGALAKAGLKGTAKAIGTGIAKEGAEHLVTNAGKDLLKSGGLKMARKVPEKVGLNLGEKGLQKVSTKGPMMLKFAGKDLLQLNKLPGAGKVVKGLDVLHDTAPVQALGKAVVPYFRPAGWAKNDWDKFTRLSRNYSNKLQFARQEAIDNVVNMSKDLTLEHRKMILHAMENPELIEQLPEEVKTAANAFQDLFKQGAEQEVKLGIMKPENMRENYVPHVLKEQTVSNKISDKIAQLFDVKKKPEPKIRQSVLGVNKQPLRANDKFAKTQRLLDDTVQNINQAKAKEFFEEDIARAAGKREASRAGAVTTQEFINDVLGKYGRKLKEGDRLATDEKIYQPKGMFSKEQYALPKDVADHLDNFQKMFTTDEGTKAMTKAYDSVMGLWKGYATAVNPGFHIRNSISNFFQNWIGGVNNPQRYVQAQRVLKGGTEKIGKYTYDDILKLAKEKGVVGKGWIGADIPEYVSQELGERLPGTVKEKAVKALNPLDKSNALMKYGRKGGTAIEDNARMAHFIDRLIKGDTPEQASMSVKKFLFDYGELTPFERNYLKRTLPFYTWTRKNLPLQVEQMIKQPGKYARANKLKNNIEQLSDKPDETYLPDYIKEGMGVRTPFGKKGQPLYYLPNIPFADIQKLNPVPSELGRTVSSLLTPALKVPMELYNNNNSYFRQPIEEYPGQMGKAMGLAYLPGVGKLLGAKDVPGKGKLMPKKTRYIAEQLITPFGSNVSKTGENLMTGDKYGAGLKLFSFLGGQKFSPYDIEKQKYYADKDRLEKLQNLLKKYRYEGEIEPSKKKKKGGI